MRPKLTVGLERNKARRSTLRRRRLARGESRSAPPGAADDASRKVMDVADVLPHGDGSLVSSRLRESRTQRLAISGRYPRMEKRLAIAGIHLGGQAPGDHLLPHRAPRSPALVQTGEIEIALRVEVTVENRSVTPASRAISAVCRAVVAGAEKLGRRNRERRRAARVPAGVSPSSSCDLGKRCRRGRTSLCGARAAGGDRGRRRQ